ncbi:MAG: prepilin-type N-terminal cleavage/methylation domain-containing protein [Gemmatimonadaceae bacterium]
MRRTVRKGFTLIELLIVVGATTKKCYAGFGSQAAATTLDGIIPCDP